MVLKIVAERDRLTDWSVHELNPKLRAVTFSTHKYKDNASTQKRQKPIGYVELLIKKPKNKKQKQQQQPEQIKKA